MKWMAMCAMLFILAGCGGAPEKFTWNDMMSGGLQSLGYNSATVSGAACTPAVINGGDNVNFEQCLVGFTDGTQIHVGKSGGNWKKW